METCCTGRNAIEYDAEFFKKFGKDLPEIISLDDLIAELRNVFESDDVNIEYVHYLMNSYKTNPADWKKYAKFDRYRYTRNLVDTGNGKYNLILLCWGEGHGSGIHDHADSHCFMKMLQGNLMEIRFGWPKNEGDKLEETGRTLLEENGVCYINDSLGLHRVENPSNVEPAVSLHLYCPPYDKCSVFNQVTGQRTTSKVTFWSMYGERRNKDTPDSREPEDN